MAKFKVTVKDTLFGEMVVEAENKDKIEEMVENGDIDLNDAEVEDCIGGRFWELYDIQEIKED